MSHRRRFIPIFSRYSAFSFLVFLEDINFIWDINGLALDVIDTHELQQSGCMMISFPIGTLALMRSIFE